MTQVQCRMFVSRMLVSFYASESKSAALATLPSLIDPRLLGSSLCSLVFASLLKDYIRNMPNFVSWMGCSVAAAKARPRISRVS